MCARVHLSTSQITWHSLLQLWTVLGYIWSSSVYCRTFPEEQFSPGGTGSRFLYCMASLAHLDRLLEALAHQVLACTQGASADLVRRVEIGGTCFLNCFLAHWEPVHQVACDVKSDSRRSSRGRPTGNPLWRSSECPETEMCSCRHYSGDWVDHRCKAPCLPDTWWSQG